MSNFNLTKMKGTWFDYPEDKEVKFLIRPISVFSLKKMPSEENAGVTPQDYWNMLNHSLMDWKGINDNGKPIECNIENKKAVLDIEQNYGNFIIITATKLRNESIISEKETKN